MASRATPGSPRLKEWAPSDFRNSATENRTHSTVANRDYPRFEAISERLRGGAPLARGVHVPLRSPGNFVSGPPMSEKPMTAKKTNPTAVRGRSRGRVADVAANFVSRTALLLGCAAASSGCSGTSDRTDLAPAEQSGSIGLELTLPGGALLSVVTYSILGPNHFASSGSIDVSNSAVISAMVGGLPPGSGYTVTLTATSVDGKTTCAGSANFSVAASMTVVVPVAIRCVKQKNNGGVIIGGTLNVCPTIDDLSVAPLSAPVGSTISLDAVASDLDNVPSPLSFTWTASSGTLAGAATPHAAFTCTVAGTTLITLVVSDGDPAPNCPATQSIDVTCASCAGEGSSCNDNNACTLDDTCHASTCSGNDAPAATPCVTAGGTVCDGHGHCVACVVAENCPGVDTACTVRTCTSNTCGTSTRTVGTACAPGKVCDANGACVACITAMDCPGQDTTCSQRTCVAGTCDSHTAPEGATCHENGGALCDGAGSCVPFTVKVARVGTGTGMLNLAAAPIFIETRSIADGSLVGTPLAIPTAASGANQPLTVGGLAVTDAQLSRTADGRYLVIGGYAATPGTLNPVNNVSVARVIGRIDAAGNVGTSTIVANSFITANLRSVVSPDGATYWGAGALGAGTDAGVNSGGLWTIQHGTTGGTQLDTSPLRVLALHGGQLYASGDTSATLSIAAIGNGLPAMPAPAVTPLAGMAAVNPWGFVFFDLNPAVPGPDAVYVASEMVGTGDAGDALRNVQKWVSNGTTWSLATTFNLPVATGYRSITGLLIGTVPTLVATTADGTNFNRLVVFTDDGVTAPRILAPSTTNTFFRGVALPPKQ
jgi:hypothetical protein